MTRYSFLLTYFFDLDTTIYDMPRYLLAPEIAALLHFLPDWSQHALINTLWNTGGRINEVLALRRRDFHLNEDIPHVVIRTAKQRRAGGGRPKKGKSANRVVPLSDPAYVDEMRRLFASTKERFEDDPLPVNAARCRCGKPPIARYATG